MEYERHGVVCVRDQFDQTWIDPNDGGGTSLCGCAPGASL